MRIEIRVKGVAGLNKDQNLGFAVVVEKDYEDSLLNARIILEKLIRSLCGHPDYIDGDNLTNDGLVNEYLSRGDASVRITADWETVESEEYTGQWNDVGGDL